MGPALAVTMALFTIGAPASEASHASHAALRLAQDGMTNYAIVIAADAADPVVRAADELSLFLGQMTRAQFEVRRDDTAASAFEIILGETNRKSLDALPSDLRPGRGKAS